MSTGDNILFLLKGSAVIVAIYGSYMILRGLTRAIIRRIQTKALPGEDRLFRLLQDRATCRTTGVDMAYLKARRWADFGDK